jgi:hypothetical protein
MQPLRGREEIEASVQAGLLHASFRTVLCASWLATGICAARAREEECSFAHGLKERRVDAAIDLGKLPRGYKTRPCRAFASADGCPASERCYWAHSVGELVSPSAPPSGAPHLIMPDAFAGGGCHP